MGYVSDWLIWDKFDLSAARVACQQLGFGDDSINWIPTTVSTEDFILDDIQCTGEEAAIGECSYTRDEDCGAHEAVELICAPGILKKNSQKILYFWYMIKNSKVVPCFQNFKMSFCPRPVVIFFVFLKIF